MHVLLTGASGFVGSHVLDRLLDDTGYRVTIVCSFRRNGGSDRVADVVRTSDAERRLMVLVHDLTAPLSARQLTQLRDVDYVVNVASLAQVDQSIVRPAEFVLNNVALQLNVLDLAVAVDAKNFVQLSTDEVHGGHETALSTHRPSSPYAASKAAQEDLCHAYARTYGLPTTIVKSANMFGERQSQKAFIPRIMRHVLRGETLPIHVTDDGSPGRRNYTYVGNVAAVLTLAARGWPPSDDNPTYLPLTGQVEVDNLTLAHRVAELMNRPLLYNTVAGSVVRPGYDESYATLTSNPNWRPDISFEDGLHRTVGWTLKNPHWLED